ncbi:hypothetical protein FUSNEC_GEN_298_01860 [Fusobacterium necrophorum subsp. funduliforme]
MITQTGNIGNNERGLLPYPVIIPATKGDPQPMNIVVQHTQATSQPFYENDP